MSADFWLIVAIVGFSLSGIALVVAIFMFIKMNIPAVISYLKTMRESNASIGNKGLHSSRVNGEREPLTSPVRNSNSSDKADISNKIKKDKPIQTNKTASLSDNVTEMLSNATEILSNNATEVLSDTTEALSNATEKLSNTTEVLSDNGTSMLNETAVLNEAEYNNKVVSKGTVPFKITRSIVMVHTEEIISVNM